MKATIVITVEVKDKAHLAEYLDRVKHAPSSMGRPAKVLKVEVKK